MLCHYNKIIVRIVTKCDLLNFMRFLIVTFCQMVLDQDGQHLSFEYLDRIKTHAGLQSKVPHFSYLAEASSFCLDCPSGTSNPKPGQALEESCLPCALGLYQ